MSVVYKHYSRREVQEAIWEFCVGRWVAIEGSIVNDRIFIRYSAGKPLSIVSKDDVYLYVYKYRNLNVRTFYASINIYSDLSSIEKLDSVQNVVGVTPFWDIDASLDAWKYAIEAAKTIYRVLEDEGITKSVYFVWSGEGIHVRIHEKAFPRDIFSDYSPIDVAYAVVEHVIRKVREDLERLHGESRGILKVENLIDMKRVFTVPLSLHRKHDVVAIVIDPRDIDNFDLSWIQIDNFRTSDAWKRYEEGEAENLVKKAIELIKEKKLDRTYIGTRRTILRDLGGDIPRFQVMALLQAARYYLLTGDIVKAKSFGLNRAIFYAYLKHYGRFYASSKRRHLEIDEEGDIVSLLNQLNESIAKESIKKALDEKYKDLPVRDGVEVSERGLFMIGGKEQTEEDFDRNVTRKIENIIPFELIWEATIKYVSRYSKTIFIDPQKFYKHVYEPVRDGFIEKVVKEVMQFENIEQNLEKARDVTTSRASLDTERIIKHHSLLRWVKKEKKS